MKAPMLRIREDRRDGVDDRRSVYSEQELPWYSIFRVNLSHLALLVTLLLALAGVWFRVEAHERKIEKIEATAQTKEGSAAQTDAVLSRLDDLRARLDRIEDRLDK
jgi:Tfp pilus assembly protein PilO